jgi:mannose-1-phosphate guanylyltransferase
MEKKVFVIIMAGGIGKRFWPYSRYSYPKQFLDVLGTGRSLLQMTFERFENICPRENIYIVSNDRYEHLINEQLPGLDKHQILLEPDRRNTGPCIAYASFKIAKKVPDARLIVTPADHAVFKEAEFVDTIRKGLNAIDGQDKLITIGIKPTRPETGYGYIQFHTSDDEVKKVKTFTEKPQQELAQKFYESGDFLWNAGIFIWSEKAITDAFKAYLPEIAETFSSMSDDYYTDREERAIEWAYAHTKAISIDYGVMEKAENVFVVPGDFGWSDLGSWASLHEIRDKDENHNVIDGKALVYNSEDCILHTPKEKLVVIQDLEGYLVADCDDVLLICKKDDEKQFRSYVNDVKNTMGDKYL